MEKKNKEGNWADGTNSAKFPFLEGWPVGPGWSDPKARPLQVIAFTTQGGNTP